MERFVDAETNPIQPLWMTALSTQVSLERAIQEVTAQVQSVGPVDLAFLFISESFTSEYSRLLPLLHEYLPVRCLVGCGGNGIIGSLPNGVAREVEGKPALSLTVARLPGVQVQPLVLSPKDLPDLDSPPQAWVDLIGVGWSAGGGDCGAGVPSNWGAVPGDPGGTEYHPGFRRPHAPTGFAKSDPKSG